jgi:dipeptidyl aminopeptidase/acylaminoacyl peptidase
MKPESKPQLGWTLAVAWLVALGCAGAEGQIRDDPPAGSTGPVAVAGAAVRAVVPDGFIGSFSPAGDQIAYSRTPENAGIAVLNLRSGARRNLTSTGAAPVWSPDGRWIAYQRGEAEKPGNTEEVWLVGADGNGARLLMAQAASPAWLPGGHALVVRSRKDDRLLRVPVDGKAPAEVFHEGATAPFPAVSPDGARVAFSRDDRLEVIDRQSKQKALHWATPGLDGLLAAWSPDGKRLAFSGDAETPIGLWIIDVEGRRAVQLAVGPTTRPAWSADGQTLAFDLREPRRRSIWAVDRGLVERCLARAGITEDQLAFGAGLCPEAIKLPLAALPASGASSD